jgi:hypothetical protein
MLVTLFDTFSGAATGIAAAAITRMSERRHEPSVMGQMPVEPDLGA